MSILEQNQINTAENSEKQWQNIYMLGAITAFIAILGTIVDIIIGSSLGEGLASIPDTAIGKFAQFHENWLLGLYNLDLLNVCIIALMIPAYFALWAAHRRVNMAYVALAAIVYFVGATVFITNNSALAMLELSNKYAAASEAQKPLLAAAGEAMIARGAHGSPGAFAGFILSTIASTIMSFGMLKGRVFGRTTAYLGIIGSILLLVYVILVTFVPEVKNIAVIVAAPGGLLALAWTIMFTLKLFQIGRTMLTWKKEVQK